MTVITGAADGLRVVETVERLLAAGDWVAADELYLASSANGAAWRRLGLVPLGRWAATAFVADADRRRLCAQRLAPDRLNFYLGAVGAYAMTLGDLTAAREFLGLADAEAYRGGDLPKLSLDRRNLCECLVWLGDFVPAAAAAKSALYHARMLRIEEGMSEAEAYQGLVASWSGDTATAETRFTAADRFLHTHDPAGDHLYGRSGVRWAEFLVRTGRPGPAARLTRRNRQLGAGQDWVADVPRCDRILGRIALDAGDLVEARTRLDAAVDALRAGDQLLELAATLPLRAAVARRSGDPAAAAAHLDDAGDLAASQDLSPAWSAALAERARLTGDRATADEALRRAVGFAWETLDALDAHADLDRRAGRDDGWAGRAAAARARLVPAGLDPDPLHTVERAAGR